MMLFPLAPMTMMVELFRVAASSIPVATDSDTRTSDLMDGIPRLFKSWASDSIRFLADVVISPLKGAGLSVLTI
ncbi:MAG: hypothetical protein BWY45_03311 [Euryarchaeota archaeon ADurb.Bin294]|nr:MAG: hypothetical protein BWY45_03311 [Euryarchaeota archaeon ADurb.Bin294]